MADMSEPVAQAYLDALAFVRRKASQLYGFMIRSVSFRHTIGQSENCDGQELQRRAAEVSTLNVASKLAR